MLSLLFVSVLALTLAILIVENIDQSNYFIDSIFFLSLILAMPAIILTLLATSFFITLWVAIKEEND
jgi:hypothetical protein